MKRLVLASTLTAVALGAAGLAQAGGNGAQKSGLASPATPPTFCTSATPQEAGKQTAHGFAVLNAPGKPGSPAAGRKILGTVALKAAPAGTYDVRLANTASSCGTSVGTLTVGQGGNGNVHFSTPGGAGTYYVVLTQPLVPEIPAITAQKYATAPVTLR